MTPGEIGARAFQSLLTLILLSFFVYGLIGLMPGDPVDLMAAGNPRMTAEDTARLRQIHGLDRPVILRYLDWAKAAVTGDLGYSRLYGLPVTEMILPRIWQTFLLLGSSLLLTLLLAVPLGVWAGADKGGWGDKIVNAACLAGISLPPFWLGLLLISFFAVTLGWLPASADLESGDTGQRLRSAVLPIATLTLANLAVYVRHLRSAMSDALKADHIRTAAAKGCSRSRVLWRHALQNAAAPVVTVLMLDIGVLFGGAMTVEMVFSWPGMGKLMFDAVMGNDYNLALTGFLVLAGFVLLGGLLADVAYGLLDPRVGKKAEEK